MRSSRRLALALTAALSIIVLAVVVKATAAPQQTLPIRVVTIKAKPAVKQKSMTATLIAEATVQTWNCQDKLVALGLLNGRTPMSSPWALPKSEKYRKWVLKQRIHKQAACLKKLHRIAYEWNWQAFPSWIIRLAVCESGGSGGASPGEPNWFAEGSSSDGTFFSAFNISRSVYDRDAHHMGVRGWYGGKGVPSPYEQAMAAIGHVRIYGDGFTGSCHGIARSSWN